MLCLLTMIVAMSPSVQAVGTTPSAPYNVTVSNEELYIEINWTAPSYSVIRPVQGYHIYRTEGTSTTYALVKTTSTQNYHDYDIVTGITYKYTVTAFNAYGDSAQSSVVQLNYVRHVPSNPSNAAASSRDGYVELAWNAPTYTGISPILGYRIYRGPTENQVDKTFTSPGTATVYHDDSAVNGTTYYYGIAAYNSYGEGNRWVGISVNYIKTSPSMTAPSAPTSVTASVVDGQIVISWNDPVDTGGSYRSYEVYRGTCLPYDISPGTSYPVEMSLLYGSLQGTYGNSYLDTTAQAGQRYCYYVVAVNWYGESEPSETVAVTAPTSPPPGYINPPTRNSGGVPLIISIPAFMAIVAIVGSVFAWRRKKKVPPSPPQEHPPIK